MNRGLSLGLWIISVLLVAAAALLYFVRPPQTGSPVVTGRSDALETAIARAATYFEFEHYDRAAETYELAVERGMEDGAQWYRYAYARDASGESSIDVYLEAYRRLLQQAPEHEYVAELESILAEYAVDFDYEASRTGTLPPGALVRFSGTISRIRWGLVESGSDTLFVSTAPDDWLGHIGNDVRVESPRIERYRAGQSIFVLGSYEGWCSEDDGAGLTREYPSVSASGIRVLANR